MSWTEASTGQTGSQGAFSQCMQGTGWKPADRLAARPRLVAVDPQPVHHRARLATSSGPTTGMLFSDWQATTQALQPMQAALSITMPQA